MKDDASYNHYFSLEFLIRLYNFKILYICGEIAAIIVSTL